MKKTLYLFSLLLLAGAMIFSACKKDDEDPTPIDYTPILTFVGGAGYTSADATFTVGATFMVGVNGKENPTSKKNLESFKVVRTFNNINTTVFEFNGINDPNFYWSDTIVANAAAGEERFTFTLTDKDGQMKELAFIITTEAATNPLSNPEALVWQRVGGAAATGLNAFGLKWTKNAKEVMCRIEKDSADKFVKLASADWASFITVEELTAAVDAGTDMNEYAGISAEVPHDDYDEVLATKFKGEYFLIHLTESTITVDTIIGTTITINGQFKK